VIAATGSPDPVIRSEHVTGADRLVCIDIAQPRDIEPALADRDKVTLYDIDALEDVTRKTRESREEEAREVEAIIDEELDRILEAYKRKRADNAISAMYAGADRVKALREVDRAVSKLEAQGGLTDEQRETVEDLADALVGQLLAAPTRSLRDAAGEDDWETIPHRAPAVRPPNSTRCRRVRERADLGTTRHPATLRSRPARSPRNSTTERGTTDRAVAF